VCEAVIPPTAAACIRQTIFTYGTGPVKVDFTFIAQASNKNDNFDVWGYAAQNVVGNSLDVQNWRISFCYLFPRLLCLFFDLQYRTGNQLSKVTYGPIVVQDSSLYGYFLLP
jgi:hypothetical protein